jgi:hypothetical protein
VLVGSSEKMSRQRDSSSYSTCKANSSNWQWRQRQQQFRTRDVPRNSSGRTVGRAGGGHCNQVTGSILKVEPCVRLAGPSRHGQQVCSRAQHIGRHTCWQPCYALPQVL